MRRIVIFLGITFALTWGYEFGIVYPIVQGSGASGIPPAATQLVIAGAMFMPAIGVVITRLVTREGFKGAMIKPVQFRRTFKYYLLAWFGPAVLIAVGGLAYFAIFPADFDPSMSAMIASVQTASTAQGVAAPPAEMFQVMVVAQLVVGVFLAPLLNCVTCFGEEWGWRGYLLPKVHKKLSLLPTVLVTGLIWGLWHAPLTAIGHNYGVGYPGFPFTGIAAMCVFCIVVGTFLSFVTLRAKSCLPAVIGHGALNGFASAAVIFSASGGNPFVGPAPIGIIGGIGFIAAAAFIVWAMRKDAKAAVGGVEGAGAAGGGASSEAG